jgi:hypothetical protein
VSSELFTKLSYVKKFEPWGWVVGSGIYIDDVERIFLEEAIHSVLLAVAATCVLLLSSWLVRKSIVERVRRRTPPRFGRVQQNRQRRPDTGDTPAKEMTGAA